MVTVSTSARERGVLPAPVGARDDRDGSSKGGPDAERLSQSRRASESEERKRLCCAACLTPITEAAHRSRQAGRHEHICSNPEGVQFRIGCFAAAPGCVMIGRPTSHWTWFAGYRWRVALCGRCGAHLGWQFRDGAGAGFFGLIVERLVDCDARPNH